MAPLLALLLALASAQAGPAAVVRAPAPAALSLPPAPLLALALAAPLEELRASLAGTAPGAPTRVDRAASAAELALERAASAGLEPAVAPLAMARALLVREEAEFEGLAAALQPAYALARAASPEGLPETFRELALPARRALREPGSKMIAAALRDRLADLRLTLLFDGGGAASETALPVRAAGPELESASTRASRLGGAGVLEAPGRTLDFATRLPHRPLGRPLGDGSNKTVYAVAGRPELALAITDQEGAQLLVREAGELERLARAGLPVMEFLGTGSVELEDGTYAALLMPRYRIDSKKDGFAAVLAERANARTFADLESIQRAFAASGLAVGDSQVFLADDGRVVVGDPLGVYERGDPSTRAEEARRETAAFLEWLRRVEAAARRSRRP